MKFNITPHSSPMMPITHDSMDPKRCVKKEWFEGMLWTLRMLFASTAGDGACVNLLKALVRGFAQWNLESVEGCGLKWISRDAKKFLLEKHGVDPRLIVENFNIGKTFDRYYPDDMELRNCLSNNKAGFEKKLTREHVVPISEMVAHLADWSIPISEIVENDFDICLITAEEDERLRKSSYVKERPGGWRRCYRECGIEAERLEREV